MFFKHNRLIGSKTRTSTSTFLTLNSPGTDTEVRVLVKVILGHVPRQNHGEGFGEVGGERRTTGAEAPAPCWVSCRVLCPPGLG